VWGSEGGSDGGAVVSEYALTDPVGGARSRIRSIALRELETARRVGQRLANVLRLEVRVHVQDLPVGIPGCDETDDSADRHAKAADTGLAAHDQWVTSDACQFSHRASSNFSKDSGLR